MGNKGVTMHKANKTRFQLVPQLFFNFSISLNTNAVTNMAVVVYYVPRDEDRKRK